jgi:hypothetical protein
MIATLLLVSLPGPAVADCDFRSVLEKNLADEAPLTLDLKPVTAELKGLDRRILDEIESGKPYSYYIDTLDEIHFLKGDQVIEGKDGFLSLKTPDGDGIRIIKESGKTTFDQTSKSLRFEAKSGWDLAPGESEALLKKIERDRPGLKVQRNKNPRLDRGVAMNCLEILSKTRSGKTFLLDNLVSSNTVAAAGILTQELSGNHLLTDPEKRKLMYSDLLANNLSILVTSPIIKRVVVSDVGPVRDFATRTTTDYLTNVLVKRPIYDAFSGTPKEEDAEKQSLGAKLVPYDTGFSVVRFYPKRVLDRALMNKVPNLLLNACLDGNELSATLGPKMIRIADRYTWGLIYLGGRKQYLEMTE